MLLLDGGDGGAAVEDCRHQLSASDCLIPRTMDLQPPHSVLLDVSEPIGDPVLDDVGPRVDSQLGLGVLLPVLTAFTLPFFSTVSTSMFSMRLMVGADLGDFALELVEDLDLEGPGAGGWTRRTASSWRPSQLGPLRQSSHQRSWRS